VGFARRVVRKSVRKATPRAVRKAMHPARTVKNAVTPRPVKQMRRAVYTVTNPLGATENALIGAALYGGRSPRRSSARSSPGAASDASWPSTSRSPAASTVQRTSEAQHAAEQLANLFTVQRQRFEAASRVQVPLPEPVDPGPAAAVEWEQRKHQLRWWQRSRRQQLRSECDAAARAHWCTILVSVIFDGLLMRPRCRQVIALLA